MKSVGIRFKSRARRDEYLESLKQPPIVIASVERKPMTEPAPEHYLVYRPNVSDRILKDDMIKRLEAVLDLHKPKVIYNQKQARVEPQPICSGCEVFWWPCPTYRLAVGAWEVVPK